MGTGQGRCGEAGEGLGEQQRVRSLAGAMISLLPVLVAPQHLQVPEPPEEQLHCSSSIPAGLGFTGQNSHQSLSGNLP